MIGKELKNHVIKWLGQIHRRIQRSNPPKVGDAVSAERRLQICMGCPHHHHVAGGCSTCKQAINGLRSRILGARTVPQVRAGACAIIGHDCLTASMLDEPALGSANLPDFCWRK